MNFRLKNEKQKLNSYHRNSQNFMLSIYVNQHKTEETQSNFVKFFGHNCTKILALKIQVGNG